MYIEKKEPTANMEGRDSITLNPIKSSPPPLKQKS